MHTNFPASFFGSWIIAMCAWTAICNIMFACQMSLFAKVSDPAIGGTYMTLLNTIANLGTMWPSTVAMWLVEPLSVKKCEGGDCEIVSDGFFTIQLFAAAIGISWLVIMKGRISQIQDLDESHWRVAK